MVKRERGGRVSGVTGIKVGSARCRISGIVLGASKATAISNPPKSLRCAVRHMNLSREETEVLAVAHQRKLCQCVLNEMLGSRPGT